MNTATCDKCGQTVAFDQVQHTLVGAFCKPCQQADSVDADRLERELRRSTGRRQLIAGVIMLAFGGTILSLGLSGGSLVIVPTGMLLGGLFEVGSGLSKL